MPLRIMNFLQKLSLSYVGSVGYRQHSKRNSTFLDDCMRS